MHTNRFALFLIVVAVIFNACKKDGQELPVHEPDPEPSGIGTQLQKTITSKKTKDSLVYTFYTYDNQDRLVNVLDSFKLLDGNWYRTIAMYPSSVKYDAQGRVEMITYRESVMDAGIYATIVYNQDDLPVKETLIRQLEKDTIINTFTYDNLKRLTIDSTFNNKKKGLIDFITYKYDGNDNVVEWERYSNASGTLQNIMKVQATYDNHPNPYQGLNMPPYLFFRNINALSRNNIVQEKYSNDTLVEYSYQYQSNGLPKIATKTTTRGGNSAVLDVMFYYK